MTERFFIDHGVIHDNKTGKHVRTCDCLAPMEGGIREACDLLNELSKSASPQPDRESETKVTDEWLWGVLADSLEMKSHSPEIDAELRAGENPIIDISPSQAIDAMRLVVSRHHSLTEADNA